MSASIHFSIRYDGPALASHQMDIQELAPALIALSNMLEQAGKDAFPNAPEVRVEVKGNFKGGSFGVDLIAVQSIGEQLISMLSGPTAGAAANLLGILSGLGLLGGGGLIGLMRWLAGRKPTAIREEDGKTIFEMVIGGTLFTFTTDLITARLYQSRLVRQSLWKVIKPLERDGIDRFMCGRDGVAEVTILEAETDAFTFVVGEADIVSTVLNEAVLLQIESAVFKEGNKWRFTDGGPSFFAEIADLDFLARIESGVERFGKGDVLIADLRRTQSVTDTGLKLDAILERVHEHRSPLQAGLFTP